MKTHTFPTYCGSGPMCSSKTKNWFQIQPRFGLWCTSVSPLASLVWFLEGTLAGLWWLTPEHLWMKQRQTRNGQRQELVDIRMMLVCGFVRLSLCSEVVRTSQHWCHSFHLQLQVHTGATSKVNTKSKVGKKLTLQNLQGSWPKSQSLDEKQKQIFTLWNFPGNEMLQMDKNVGVVLPRPEVNSGSHSGFPERRKKRKTINVTDIWS